MKQLLIGMLLLIAVLSTGCDLFSSQPSDQGRESGRPAKADQVPATLALPAGACQSRLGGKLTNSKSAKPPENAVVEIVSGNKKLQTKADKNGLYGFAGLCAGQYAVSITPPGGARKSNVSRIELDGSNPAKLDLSY